MATLLGIAGYLVYIACIMASSLLVVTAAMSAFPPTAEKHRFSVLAIAIVLPFVLKNMMISEFPFTFPSNLSEMTAKFLGLAGYLVYIASMMAFSFLALIMALCICRVALRTRPGENCPDWIFMIVGGVTFAVTDMFMEHSRSVSAMMANLVFLAGYLAYIVCMVALPCVVLITAFGAIWKLQIWCPVRYFQLALTVIVGLTLMLLNMMWATPFEKPSTDSDMKAALVGLGGYLIYIVCSMALSYKLLESMKDSFIVSLTLVLLHMCMKPFSISNMVLTPLLALMALSFLVVLSFLMVIWLGAWAQILLSPDAFNSYPNLMPVSIIVLSFMAMKCMLATLVDMSESLATLPSIFSHMKATLVGFVVFINHYRITYLVMRYVAILSLVLLPLVLKKHMSTCGKQCYKPAIIIALAVVLTMQMPPLCTPIERPPLIYESPFPTTASTLVFDEFIRFSEEMRVEHKMGMEKVILGFNLLIEESKGAIQNFVVHTILILMTLIGGMVLYVRSQYLHWIDNLTKKLNELLEGRYGIKTIAEKANVLTEKAISKAKLKKEEYISEAKNQAHTFSLGLFGTKRPEKTPQMC